MNAGSQLLQNSSSVQRRRHKSTTLVSLLCGFLAMLVLFTTVFASLGNVTLNTAHADSEEEPQGILSDAADDYGVDRSPEGFEDVLEKASAEDTNERENTFSELLTRVFSTGYINEVHEASPPMGESAPASGRMCNTNDDAAGTLVYHNCDVPNLVTEFFQDIVGSFAMYGIQDGQRHSSAIDNRWFGLPSGIPGEVVPVDPNDRSVEYTALEVFGYSPLRYTTYEGEWDHIKAMSEARALANYGAMDNIKLGINVITDSVAGGMEGAVDGWEAGMESGGILAAISGSLTGVFEGATSAGVTTVLDTSDYNVMNSDGWYRINIGGTLYNAREMTQQELAAEAQQQFINMVSEDGPATAEVPEDLQAVQTLPEAPQNGIASCDYRKANGDMTTHTSNSAPGPSEDDCLRMAESASDGGNVNSADWSWNAEGSQSEETLAEWEEEHSNYFAMADKYNIQCDLSTNESDRVGSWSEFSTCWNRSWDTAAAESREQEQRDTNTEWSEAFLDPETFATFMAENEAANFNAPHNRFVCLDSNGKDIIDANGVREKVYNANGNLNDACSPTRQPIQDGMFGNGYTNDVNISEDTRHQGAGEALMSIVFPFDQTMSTVSSGLLTISVFITRISNTVINLSFSPIFETIGLDEMAISFIESIRDGIFFPLALLVLAVAGISIIVKAARQQNYAQQFGNILLIVLTFIVGLAIMLRPADTIKMVDTVPAMAEQAVLGAIFSAGSAPEDNMCTASGTVATMDTPENLDGSAGRYNPSTGLRSLMCENWRAFAFTPWTYGQFGTGVNDLYGAETDVTGNNSTVQNSAANQERVGDPTVRFGQNSTMTNWAVYQLDAMSSGSATTQDYTPGNLPGTTDPNMYRIVDFQAGPNGGAGTDSRFLESWSGENPGERLAVSGMSVIVAFFGAFTIIAYSITKVTITFISTVMLMFLPFMMLFGLYPGVGMRKLRGYIGSIVALMIQRVMITVLLAIMLTIIMAASNTDGGYLLVSTLAIIASWFFFSIRKKVMSWISEATASTAGSSFGGSAVADPDKATGDAIKKSSPGFVKNAGQAITGAAGGFVTGGVGSFLAGGKFMDGANKSARMNLGRLHNMQRRKGFGFVQGSALAIGAAADDAKHSQDRDKRIHEISRNIAQETDSTKSKQALNDAQKELGTVKGEDIPVADDQERASDGSLNTLNTSDNNKTRRDLKSISDMQQRIEDLKSQKLNVDIKDNKSRAKLAEESIRGQNVQEIAETQRRQSEDRREQYRKIQEEDAARTGEKPEETPSTVPTNLGNEAFESYRGYDTDVEVEREIRALENQIESTKNRIINREDDAYKYSSEDAKMRRELSKLRAETERERIKVDNYRTDDDEGKPEPEQEDEQPEDEQPEDEQPEDKRRDGGNQ